MVLGPIYYHEKPVERHLFTLFSGYRRLEILIHFPSFHYFENFACSSGDSEITIIVIDESTDAGDQAKKLLEDVRATFPRVVVTMCFYHLTQIIIDWLA